ncbi:Sel1 repeat protein [compost metagenome]
MLAKFHRERGDAASALRWDLRATIYHHMPSESSRLPQAIAAQPDGTLHPLVVDIQRRAQRGDADAQVDLGAMYELGMGLPRDGVEALRWYRRSADQGNVYGQYFSGLLLGRGRAGVTRDLDAAAGWFAKAYAQKFYLAGETYWRERIKAPFWTFD